MTSATTMIKIAPTHVEVGGGDVATSNPVVCAAARKGEIKASVSGPIQAMKRLMFDPPSQSECGARRLRPVWLEPRAGCLDRALLQNAVLACLGHREDRDQEHDRRHDDGIDKRIPDAPRGEIHRGRDDRDQAAPPAIADVVWHRYRRVADAAREELGQ